MLKPELAEIRDNFNPEEKHSFLTEDCGYSLRWEKVSANLSQGIKGALYTGLSVEKAYPVYFIPFCNGTGRRDEWTLTLAPGHGRDGLQGVDGISNAEALEIFWAVLEPQTIRVVDHGSMSDTLVDNIGRRF